MIMGQNGLQLAVSAHDHGNSPSGGCFSHGMGGGGLGGSHLLMGTSAIVAGPVIPLVMYAIGRRRSPFRRFHAATALNLSLTGLLYAVCCLVLCGMLLLDSRTAALAVVIPIAAGIWLSVLRYLIRGIAAAKRGAEYDMPAWICARIAS